MSIIVVGIRNINKIFYGVGDWVIKQIPLRFLRKFITGLKFQLKNLFSPKIAEVENYAIMFI